MRTKISSIFSSPQEFKGKTLTLKGWVRTLRDQKHFAFVELNDGSTLSNFQILLSPEIPNYAALLEQISTGASLSVTGIIVENPRKENALEMQAKQATVLGKAPESFPLQKKRHSFEFLRSIAHLRPRTNTIRAVVRLRNALSFATHQFFQSRGFLYVHTPIITGSDCEGGGKMFQVTTLDLSALAKSQSKDIDYEKDFFSKPTYLTVSGQLNAESLACALSDVYTFGPTFRAENSNTSRHLAEFWMIEPEMAFADLNDDIELAESYLKFLFQYILDHCQEDLEFFDRTIAPGLLERLKLVATASFERLSYTEAIALLEKSKKSFEFPVKWGVDLQSEHERFLTEEIFLKPLILTDYPKEIKAFYMRANEDGKTVAAMDILFPKIGEIIGGSQREERLEILEKKLEEFQLNPEDYKWYLELRTYGSVPHAGFGAGFERLVQFATGMDNIRDIALFPRYPGNAAF